MVLFQQCATQVEYLTCLMVTLVGKLVLEGGREGGRREKGEGREGERRKGDGGREEGGRREEGRRGSWRKNKSHHDAKGYSN